MIKSITLNNIATYQSAKIDDLAQVNFFYGANGSGKTTISKIIANPNLEEFSNCQVEWKDSPLQTMVYNQEFVERNFNFNHTTELKGIFTLGENQVDTEAKINIAKSECNRLQEYINNDTASKSKKEEEKKICENDFKNITWNQKNKYQNEFQEIFRGYIGSKDKFKTKILEEYNKHKNCTTENLLDLSSLKEKYDILFKSDLNQEPEINLIDASILISHENNFILKKRIVGNHDIDISELIEELGNSDWVRQGVLFLDKKSDTCPFCQQGLRADFRSKIENYFDRTFLEDNEKIKNLRNNYEESAKYLTELLNKIIQSNSRFLEIEKFKLAEQIIANNLSNNILLLNEKIREPSIPITLSSISETIFNINELIKIANTRIKDFNNTISNAKSEQASLCQDVWKFIITELKSDIETYNKKIKGIDAACLNLENRIGNKCQEKYEKEEEIRTLASQLTSIQPTVDGINSMLLNFGFDNFKLEISNNQKGYQLVRSNGEIARHLSEGEKTFVTFLYFYHLLKGGIDDNGLTADRVVVFDDPISSLDSDILFIVSTLIRNLLLDSENGNGYVKQIIVLTHNLYFYKEITFEKRIAQHKKMPTYKAWNKKFWIVRKCNMISNIEQYNKNPINTSYELLWLEVKKQDLSNHNLPNTLRKILENYFCMWGGIALDELPQRFTDIQEQRLCEMLLYWANAGSHSLDDEQYFTMTDDTIQKFLSVFKRIFEETGQIAHYNMMLK